jgi:predicted NAD/FAD-binding protein
MLREPSHYCVTLNRSDEIREDRVIETIDYDHPLYTHESLRAQGELPRLNTRTTVFCGAYHGYGFHEDGLVSGLAAARALGAQW